MGKLKKLRRRLERLYELEIEMWASGSSGRRSGTGPT